MIKQILYGLILVYSLALNGQEKYYTNTGYVEFEASVPSFEEVRATCNSVTSILNVTTGEIAALVLVKGFRFKVALMEEHFNENYAESDRFPKATLKGKITNFKMKDLNEAMQSYEMEGILNFHGKPVEITPILKIAQNDENIFLSSEFIVKLEDFDIEIPKLIQKKVAETVRVTVDFTLVPRS